MIDLHIHSNYSDGTSSVKDILKQAEELKLEAISITDHESYRAYEELETINIKEFYSGEIILGVELKNYYKDRIIDMLAYNVDTVKLREYLKTNYENKTHRILQTKYLKHFYKQAQGYDLKLSPINTLKWDKDRDWASLVFYNELKKYPENKEKIPSDLWESFVNFKNDYVYNRNNIFFLDKKGDFPKPEQTVEIVHKFGGKIFLAHVYEYKWVEDKIEFIKELMKKVKLDGIECYYSNFTKEEQEKLKEFCRNNNLSISGGTDYHGRKRPGIEIGTGRGNLQIPAEILKTWK